MRSIAIHCLHDVPFHPPEQHHHVCICLHSNLSCRFAGSLITTPKIKWSTMHNGHCTWFVFIHQICIYISLNIYMYMCINIHPQPRFMTVSEPSRINNRTSTPRIQLSSAKDLKKTSWSGTMQCRINETMASLTDCTSGDTQWLEAAWGISHLGTDPFSFV